jgi:hypothetical protein
MSKAYPGVKFSLVASNPLGVKEGKKLGIPGIGLPRAIYDKNASSIKNLETIKKVVDANRKWGSSSGFTTFTCLKYATGLSFQEVFGVVREMRDRDPYSTTFSVDRAGENTVVKFRPIAKKQIVVTKGGKGSGNFGHTGRPGEVGGSTSGGSHYGNPPSASDADKEARKERKARRSKIVKDAADKLGIDIPVKYSDQVKTFTVAGNRYKTMGVYRALHKDVIIFNCSGADNPERVGASLAHEYNHHKFNMVIHEPIRTGNATPAQEGLLDKFVEYEILGNPMVESGKSISSYASSFWKAFSKNRTTGAHLIAINETLAEVAKAIHMGKRDSLPKAWVDIYDELDEVYRGLK